MCKNIDVSLNYKEVAIYLKYSTPHPLWKLVKIGGKVDVYKSICDGEHKLFLGMEKECEVFCVKIILRLIVAQKGTNMLIFYIFEYSAEYGPECSAESGAK